MKKILIIAAMLAAMFCMTVPVMASTSVVVNDDVTVERYDWSADWDANQNNAYVDIISGILSGKTEMECVGSSRHVRAFA